MEITYDKNQFRNIEKIVLKGKSRYGVRQAFIGVIVNIPVMLFVMFVLSENNSFLWQNVIIILIISVVSFIPYYFLYRWQYRQVRSLYDNTRNYWEKHDPSFFKVEKYEDDTIKNASIPEL